MSLTVPADLLARAEDGAVDDADFVDCVRTSLPYAWAVVSDVASRAGDLFAEHAVPPPSETERGQLLRALASDSIRAALERHFGVKLAFQNCHRVAAFAPATVDGDVYREFVSPLAQIRNQTPELRDC
ncbi:MAG TPA: SCO5389 family protein [Asanoa sp.]|nr:SCO5389 family protein [Asanoa sp.]